MNIILRYFDSTLNEQHMKKAALQIDGKTYIVRVNSVSSKGGIINYNVTHECGETKVYEKSGLSGFHYLMS